MIHDDFDPKVWDRMCDFAGWACVAICTVAFFGARLAGYGLMPRAEPHALIRARERLGVDWVYDDLLEMQEKIAAGGSLLLGRTRSGKEERHALRHKDVDVCAIYDPVSGFIVTIYEHMNARDYPERYKMKPKKQRIRGRARGGRREKAALRAKIEEGLR